MNGIMRHQRPLRIGFWACYNVTLEPSAGIGVFLYNLLHGLADLDENVELVLLVRPGDQERAAGFVQQCRRPVRILPEPGWRPPPFPPDFSSLIAVWRAGAACCRKLSAPAGAALARLADWQTSAEASACAWMNRARLYRLPLVAFGLLVALLLAWPVALVGGLAAAILRGIAFPFQAADRLVERLAREPRFQVRIASLRGVARAAGCDLWVIPYVGFPARIDFPSVVFIHDLVTHHFPEMFDPAVVARIREYARLRSAEATLCACMSEFIRDTDLRGVLGLPDEKIRMVRPAAPRDFPRLEDDEIDALVPPELTRPFLLLPAEYRPYKGHRRLVEALAVLRDRHGIEDLDLVFTGSPREDFPRELLRQIEQLGLADHVHLLGRVSRRTLAALYSRAQGCVVPTLYEQGSFPIYEALSRGCPVACSRIPALEEQCRALGEAMLYFDPNDPVDMARCLRAILLERERVRARQQALGRLLWQRTWTDVAREWLAVFREAFDQRRPALPTRALAA
jgi:glycosyltransferase involved in cell wall biosynthesis